MTDSPLTAPVAFTLGTVPVSFMVVVTWVIMAVLVSLSIWITRRLQLQGGTTQNVSELLVATLDAQINGVMQGDPSRFRTLVGTLFIFILTANWISLIPNVDPPTAYLETDAALAAIVFFATIAYGIRANGLLGYLRTFAKPSWVMIPLNLIEQVTRTFALMVRLFGNVMSGVFVIGIILSLAGLLVPIPLMALDLLTGAVQAYIFAVLSAVFIASAVTESTPPPTPTKES